MRGWLLVVVAWILSVWLVLTVLSTISESQTPGPTCEALPACMVERVRDFRDLVEYLQSELAYCKSVNKGMTSTLNEVRGELEAAKKKLPLPTAGEPPK